MTQAETRASEIADGGGAFPTIHIVSIHGEIQNAGATGGMSLRDYFAGRATLPILADALTEIRKKSFGSDERTGIDDRAFSDGDTTYAETVAEEAYIMADALLRERSKGAPPSDALRYAQAQDAFERLLGTEGGPAAEAVEAFAREWGVPAGTPIGEWLTELRRRAIWAARS